MKATVQYFPVVKFIMLYKVVVTFEPVNVILKATVQYFPVVKFIMLYQVVVTFEPVNVIPKCDHSNESY